MRLSYPLWLTKEIAMNLRLVYSCASSNISTCAITARGKEPQQFGDDLG